MACQQITKALMISMVVCLVEIFAVGHGLASLIGDASIGYVSYERESDGTKLFEGSTFRQDYSLRYLTSGAVANGRLAKYRLGVGYEWHAFDTQISHGTDISQTAGKFIYTGSFLLDPQEMPIKLRLFSEDVARPTPYTDGRAELQTASMIAPGLQTGFANPGIRIVSGASLALGVKNRTYGYNGLSELFSSIPLILVDYRDEISRNLSGDNQVNSRMRTLAFASLNKGDNWLHYKRTRFDDYLTPSMSFSEDMIVIGNVDQSFSRKWVSFTNWINVSADGKYQTRDDWNGKSQLYEMNLFSVMNRNSWEARTFNTFTRLQDVNGLKYEAKIPVYLSIWEKNADWRIHLNHDWVNNMLINQPAYETYDQQATVNVTTFKYSPFNLSETVSVARTKNPSSGENYQLSSTTATTSNNRFSSKYALGASYSIYGVVSGSNSEVGNSMSHVFQGTAVYKPASNFDVALRESVTIATNGSNPSSISGVNNSSMATNTLDVPSSSYRSYNTNVSVRWEPKARLRIGLTLDEDITSAGMRRDEYATNVANTIDYSKYDFKLTLRNTYNRTDKVALKTETFSSNAIVSYKPNKITDSTLSYWYTRSHESNSGSSTNTDIAQNTNYYIYKVNGVNRRLIELNEEVTYSKKEFYASPDLKNKSLLLGMSYYPLSRLSLSGRARYSLIDNGGIHTTQMVYNASVNLNFQKMQASLAYSYGKSSGDSKVMERKFEANLRKIF